MNGVKIFVIIIAIIVGLLIVVNVARFAYENNRHVSAESSYIAGMSESLQ